MTRRGDIAIAHHGLHLLIRFDDRDRPLLAHLSASPPPADLPADLPVTSHLVQLQGDQPGKGWIYQAMRGLRHGAGLPGMDLVYHGHQVHEMTDGGRLLEIRTALDGLEVTSRLRFAPGSPVVQLMHAVTNHTTRSQLITDLPSLLLRTAGRSGQGHGDTRQRIHRCDNAWFSELRWQSMTLAEAGLVGSQPASGSSGSYLVANTGSWSCKSHLPMGMLEDLKDGTTLAWQIEHCGGWYWELAEDGGGRLALAAGGPCEQHHQWWRELGPGETWESVPAALAAVRGGWESALQALLVYRRADRLPFADCAALPVIFNDYMNCLHADPTTERELPLIAAASKAGCEYYVIDAGWYAPRAKGWFATVGQWQESPDRFPDGGLRGLLQCIQANGMVPGLWLELEMMGVDCPLAQTAPPGWFFQRHGRPVVFSGRYQLDFRHPGVQAHADEVVDRLVSWGVGYIKMDYNIDTGLGTDADGWSAGEGALQHMRAYWEWLERVYIRHPGLVVENCSSGGLRMDWGQLRRHSIQSTSDQDDWRLTPYIAAAAATAAPPEQQAFWSYPLKDGDREEAICNLVSGMVGRIHQSGQLADLPPERFALVSEGIAVYKRHRRRIPGMRARWPWGLPAWRAPRTAVVLQDGDGLIVAIWRLSDPVAEQTLAFPDLIGQPLRASCIFPTGESSCSWDTTSGTLRVTFPDGAVARLIELTYPPG